ncbi:MAG: cyclase family protein [Ardenticatenales bacterium]
MGRSDSAADETGGRLSSRGDEAPPPAVDGGWIDISLPITAASVPWPGLDSPTVARPARMEDGDSVNVGVLNVCLHTAAHADAPFHVSPDGATIERVGLDAYLGEARLVRLPNGAPAGIDRAALLAAGLPAQGRWPRRLLIATGRPYDGVHWPTSIPAVAPDAAVLMVERGVALLGVDVPSVDPLDSRALTAHHILMDGGVAIVENLRFGGTPAGRYWLSAVPLAIHGGDASPVRAVMRPLADD